MTPAIVWKSVHVTFCDCVRHSSVAVTVVVGQTVTQLVAVQGIKP